MRLSSGTKLLLPFLAVMTVFFMAPLCIALGYSFMAPDPMGGVKPAFSLSGYQQFLYSADLDGNLQWDTRYLEIIFGSTKLAVMATLACLVIGFPMAWFMATRPAHQRDAWMILITIPFWTNLLIRTYAWILILRSNGLVNRGLLETGIIDTPLELLYNPYAVGMGLVYSYLPFMILPIYSSLERMDWRLVEAAQDLYATRLRILWHVVLPASVPGIVGGTILVFIPTIGSFLAANLLGGGRNMMLGNLIENQFGMARNWPFGAAISVLLIAFVMIGLMLIARRGQGLKGVVG
ncbi:MAG TPA: ABC transporter permease [Alphaproteobacteria bacterium]|nr:ABC transporter permease [Alphaproteobacteria bacterium]